MTPFASFLNPEGESPFYNEFFFFGLVAFGFALGIATGIQYCDSTRFWWLISIAILAIVCAIGYVIVALQFEPEGLGRGLGLHLLAGYVTFFAIFAWANLILAAIISVLAELTTRNGG